MSIGKQQKNKIPWNKGNHIYLGGGFKKGCTAWNKGKKCPYVSERNKVMNQKFKKEGNPNWKGGRWNHVKKETLLRDNYTCRKCGFNDKDKKKFMYSKGYGIESVARTWDWRELVELTSK